MDVESPTALFVCENISAHAIRSHSDPLFWGYTEYDALRLFLSKSCLLGEKTIDNIVVRPHPTEDAGKYDAILEEFNLLPVSVSRDRTLAEDIARSNWVVGCNSTAMVIGLLAGKRVISSIPPGGRPCVLPFPEIERLDMLLDKAR